MENESCYERYKSYFSPELRDAFIENNLTLPHILEFAEEQCDNLSCKHHVFCNRPDNLLVNPEKQQDVPFVHQCHGCMCLLHLITDLPSVIDIANAYGIRREGVLKQFNHGIKKVRKLLKIKQEVSYGTGRSKI